MAVNWLELIRTDFVHLQQEFDGKDAVLEFLAEQLSRSAKLAKCRRIDILASLQAREAKGSTGLGSGIAAPHCGMKKAEDFAIIILTLAHGIDFGAFDSQPCNFIISIVGPEAERSRHVQILASLASGLQKTEEVQALLTCSEQDQAMDILGRMFGVDFRSGANEKSTGADQNTVAAETEISFCRLSIFVQKEQFFAPMLEEAVRASGGQVVIMEGHNIAEYLHRMPLYAYVFSNKKLNKFFRCIEAIVPQDELSAVYDTLRRIDRKIGEKPGTLVFHQHLSNVIGSLDY